MEADQLLSGAIAGGWILLQFVLCKRAFRLMSAKGQRLGVLQIAILVCVLTLVPLLVVGFITLAIAATAKDYGHGGKGGSTPWR